MNQSTSTTTKKTLLTLLQEREELLFSILESGGEITQQVEGLFNENTDDLQQKVEGYVWLIETLEAEAERKKQKSTEFAAKAKACSGLAASIRDRAKHLMQFGNVRRLVGTDHELVLSNSRSVLLCNEEIDFWRKTPYLKTETVESINKDAIRTALEAGQSIEGARLEERFSLRIQVQSAKGKSHEQIRTN